MKYITQITTVFSLIIICNSYSQNTVDPNNTIEEKTIFTVLEENGKTKYFGQFYKNKKKGIGTEFLANGKIRTGYFENDEFLGEFIVNPPWHIIDIDYFFRTDISFDELSVDLIIKNEISTDEFLYIAPFCGKINGIDFYAGIQSQTGGYINPDHNEEKADYHEIGKAMIFSRWETRNINALQKATNGVCESSGYEGDFISVRNRLEWETGKYTLSLKNTHETVEIEGIPHTFVEFNCYDHQKDSSFKCGSLAFPGEKLFLDKSNYIFVELYSKLTKISDTPKGSISVGNFKYVKPGSDFKSRIQPSSAFALYDVNSPQWARSWHKERMFHIQFGEPYVREYPSEYDSFYLETLKRSE